ncbi:MAG: HDOD domain-containing protein [Candidatus Cloacimonadales bacterium]|nr:HDOD domain-containing protein [Candidatus Cloacimonadota bacterium]MDD2649617.1 HDOD domain-containing protein [Candidatus Cloacimonadota bacterium]MDX9976605.1 HDOD domain-containing protein [Candidatus Cloacimonadales bacterium]
MMLMKDLVQAIEFLPAFNQNALKAMELIRSDNYTNKRLSDIIKLDASLSANILKISNSALYAKPKQIYDVSTAISLLGKQQIYSLLTLISTQSYFADLLDGYEVYKGELWEHNLAVAVIAENLAYLEKNVDKSILFTAGLLHDIGKIILSIWVKKEANRIDELVDKENFDFIDAEKTVLGFTHSDIGAAILKHWNFPEQIINSAKYHHDDKLFNDPIVRLVTLADFLSFTIGFLAQKDNMYMKSYDQVLKYYNIKTKDVEKMIADNIDKVLNIINEFKLIDRGQ